MTDAPNCTWLEADQRPESIAFAVSHTPPTLRGRSMAAVSEDLGEAGRNLPDTSKRWFLALAQVMRLSTALYLSSQCDATAQREGTSLGHIQEELVAREALAVHWGEPVGSAGWICGSLISGGGMGASSPSPVRFCRVCCYSQGAGTASCPLSFPKADSHGHIDLSCFSLCLRR